MSNLNSDLIARIYAASDTPLTNEELYREVQRETGMSDAELQKMKAFGSDKMRTSGVKHQVRWYQQTLRQAGVIERVPEKRGVWRYAFKNDKKLHESWDKLCVVGFSTSLGASVFGNAYAFFSNINEQIHLCLTSPPFLLRNARNYGHGGGRGEQAYIDWLLRILEPIVKQLVPGGSVALNVTQDSFNPGRPSRSLYLERLTLALCDKLGLELMDRLNWVNRAKPRRRLTGRVNSVFSSVRLTSRCCGLLMTRKRFVRTTCAFSSLIQSSIRNCRRPAAKTALHFTGMALTSLKMAPSAIRQKGLSPKIRLCLAMPARIRGSAIASPANWGFRCTVQRHPLDSPHS